MLSRSCTVEDILPLRHAVLRAGKPLETARFSYDELETTRHYGLFDDNLSPLVCLTLLRQPLKVDNMVAAVLPGLIPGSSVEAWQLRGMATAEGQQGSGLGTRLMQFALEDAQTLGFSEVFWCNARIKAVKFYQRNGWQIVSEEFDVPGIGPHFVMIFAGNL
jgi:predicted GNAT family N-acyltransferase